MNSDFIFEFYISEFLFVLIFKAFLLFPAEILSFVIYATCGTKGTNSKMVLSKQEIMRMLIKLALRVI